MEVVKIVEKKQLSINYSKLSWSSNEEYYNGVPLHHELFKHYQIDVDNLKHLLLSPRSQLHMDISVVKVIT